MNLKSSARLLAVPLLALWSTGCLRYYTQYPHDKIGKPPAQRYDAQLQYRIKPYPSVVGSGRRGLEEAFAKQSPFKQVLRVEDIPARGLFCDVEVQWIQPGLGALIFFYVSLATYFVIPQWSIKEGYRLVFDVYRDGRKLDTYAYEVKRRGFSWLPLIVVTWVNAITPHENEVFESLAYQFFDDAARNFPDASPAASGSVK